MRIVLCTVNHIYSNKILKELIKEFGRDIKLIIESGALLQNKSKLQALIKYIRVSGIYYVFLQTFKLEIFKFLSLIYTRLRNNTDNKFFHYHRLSEGKKIPVISLADINSPDTLALLKKINPDIIVSVLFNQILKSEVIKLPKKGAINIHPAYLPDYKGTGPVFWALTNDEKNGGVTVHYINEGIDTGKIIKRQKIEFNKNDTEDSLYWKAANLGAPLLISAIKEISSGRVKTTVNNGGRCFTIPTVEAVRKFRSLKRRFFRLSSYLFAN